MTAYTSLERKLGYRFNNRSLLTRALTHRSRGGMNNERLEFLGDSILGFAMAEVLYRKFPKTPEGDLTKMRSRLVRKETLAALARDLDMQGHLLLGSGELKSGGFDRDSILADAFEAVMAAIYLDSDLSRVSDILLALYENHLSQISPKNLQDHKTRLQEHLQKHDLPLPVYEVIGQQGKPHALTFTVSCTISALTEPVIASGVSRRSAEQKSAEKALSLLHADV